MQLIVAGRQSLDRLLDRQGAVLDIAEKPHFSLPPSFRDRHGVRSLDDIGVDTVTFETDYPHPDSTWPDSRAVAEEETEGLDRSTIEKVIRGNAIRMLQLDL